MHCIIVYNLCYITSAGIILESCQSEIKKNWKHSFVYANFHVCWSAYCRVMVFRSSSGVGYKYIRLFSLFVNFKPVDEMVLVKQLILNTREVIVKLLKQGKSQRDVKRRSHAHNLLFWKFRKKCMELKSMKNCNRSVRPQAT